MRTLWILMVLLPQSLLPPDKTPSWKAVPLPPFENRADCDLAADLAQRGFVILAAGTQKDFKPDVKSVKCVEMKPTTE